MRSEELLNRNVTVAGTKLFRLTPVALRLTFFYRLTPHASRLTFS